MDYRTIFDTVPEQFDMYRPRYCDELYADLIDFAKLDAGNKIILYDRIVMYLARKP